MDRQPAGAHRLLEGRRLGSEGEVVFEGLHKGDVQVLGEGGQRRGMRLGGDGEAAHEGPGQRRGGRHAQVAPVEGQRAGTEGLSPPGSEPQAPRRVQQALGDGPGGQGHGEDGHRPAVRARDGAAGAAALQAGGPRRQLRRGAGSRGPAGVAPLVGGAQRGEGIGQPGGVQQHEASRLLVLARRLPDDAGDPGVAPGEKCLHGEGVRGALPAGAAGLAAGPLRFARGHSRRHRCASISREHSVLPARRRSSRLPLRDPLVPRLPQGPEPREAFRVLGHESSAGREGQEATDHAPGRPQVQQGRRLAGRMGRQLRLRRGRGG